MELRLVLTTIGNEKDAERVAKLVVESGLAACVNVIPVTFSVYRWKGKLEKEPELLLLMKTPADRVSDLKSKLKEIHPYETPEIVELAASAVTEGYLAWVVEATRGIS